MSRASARKVAVQLVFAAANSKQSYDVVLDEFFSEEHLSTFAGEDVEIAWDKVDNDMEYIRSILSLVSENQEKIDSIISKYSKGWRLERISKTALAVMRVAICEILYVEDIPAKVSVNEAVEIDKGYDVPETVSFVNGVLGSFVKEENKSDV